MQQPPPPAAPRRLPPPTAAARTPSPSASVHRLREVLLIELRDLVLVAGREAADERR
ncbi:unnamed protein product, partial [Linum tenue]